MTKEIYGNGNNGGNIGDGEEQPSSLEYIEDPYFQKLPQTATPSLDELVEFDHRSLYDTETTEWSPETELYLRTLPLEQIFSISHDEDEDVCLVDLQQVETEMLDIGLMNADDKCNGQNKNQSKLNGLFKKLFLKKSMRDVRVTFIDFSKPYLAKISSNDNYKQFLNIGFSGDGSEKLSDNSPSSASVRSFASAEFAEEFNGLTLEEQERLRTEWSQDLARVEEEIQTLRTVLTSKVRHANELKRKLGITVWKEISDDMNQGIKNVKESSVYQKTESALKSTAEKTSSIFGGITSGISSKISQMKKSESYKSIEEKVGNAYENVKTKVGSRSGSISSYDESHTSTAPQSPTITEERPII